MEQVPCESSTEYESQSIFHLTEHAGRQHGNAPCKQ
jgi:hypothetical protein